jgi:hypothetical protein
MLGDIKIKSGRKEKIVLSVITIKHEFKHASRLKKV